MKRNFNDKQIQILEVAETLFAEKGFDGTSIRNIAKIAKINIAMVSYYFGSKERLLESLIVYRTSDLKNQLEHLLLEDLEPLDKINKLIELYINRINSNRGIYRILHFEFPSKKSKQNLSVFSELKKGNLKSLEIIIKEGQNKGIFRKDIIIPLITPTILGTFFHFHMNKPFFENLLNLKTEDLYNNYIKTNLTTHIQQTVKALLIYEMGTPEMLCKQ
ncbi:TetR/AcrR family transcriptional regulator [Flavobacterium sp. LS1P28]|uniref:TetR/AcrR family transcriptional regulator n=1 Tax=unclassified Flavobacterium TaxID=196869 RepID=UPI000F8251AD|nr:MULTISPECIES: TetR/AcrR family transcriptional regulator [unclassified Flavobacterium]RTY72738.1 TetR/AcrR family transcriptional regulator [Flavobacterium sp. LS1R10]RTY81084.1 TetR/AcrR family transcriptional regulator [Flavobacterium sp. ZB4P23]RTY81107.1 TetR/AcrR family transcriptional regulator [Flavobacterium sp. LS1P28]RTY89618.1 TetR/AcrR family transcriptional regulator [Flavobacterium sp. RSP46]RTZ02651.1 TetR/AcrR family transcriptional regulator [Flavobacterium sp. GSP6]